MKKTLAILAINLMLATAAMNGLYGQNNQKKKKQEVCQWVERCQWNNQCIWIEVCTEK